MYNIYDNINLVASEINIILKKFEKEVDKIKDKCYDVIVAENDKHLNFEN